MKSMKDLTSELAAAEKVVENIKLEIENFDDYPLGTVLKRTDDRLFGTFVYAIKMASINSAHLEKSHVPVWRVIYDDFSGFSDTLPGLKSEGTWKVAYMPEGTW
ncbi:hypothetical protein [Mycolicibacterium palauense]|uniref:hypothetical protein n=1 Tax=Mycolicibacterium palauense TaxID=2034511 RepID=UPI000BFED3D4|nr:hypothetical protein [Mycolicibacterium palauense]